ncbi:MAG: phage holin family protein [Actinomycetota bacterium]|nr:phage holin family protein [Actinomycetota bacterium]
MDDTESLATHGTDGAGPKRERSTIELVRAIAQDSSTLVRQELQLARQEVTEAVKAKAIGAGALAAAGAMGLLALIFLAVAGAAALDIVLPRWAAWLIVGGTFLVLAGGAAMFGLRRMKRPSMKPEETVRTVKEDVEWAKAQLKR